MTSPFGYDYYLSLATLRDADNDTLVDAYLAGMAPVAGMLSETLRNLTELNETLKASRETHLHARRALAHARGARRVATEALYDAEYRLKSLRDAVSSAFVEACVEIKILRRVRAESSRRPPRHRRDAYSMAWRCRFLTARPSQNGRIIAEK